MEAEYERALKTPPRFHGAQMTDVQFMATVRRRQSKQWWRASTR